MKREQSAPAGYRPHFAGTTKLYLVRHKEYGELTVARECEYIVLAEDTPEAGKP